jgi:hypothetical protein
MYTSIDTEIGLDTLREKYNPLTSKLPHTSILKSHGSHDEITFFSFQNTYWLQLSGTVMETPVACAYTTITYGHYKNAEILPQFKDNLLYYTLMTFLEYGSHQQLMTWNLT